MRADALVYALVLLAAAACARTEAAARSVPAGAGFARSLERALAVPARLTVVYWPATGECMPHEAAAIEVLRELAARYPDLRFVTVVRRGIGRKDPRYGLEYPGELVEVDASSFAERDGLGPRPRVAAWANDGALLFARSLPPVVSEAVRLRDEITWTRALTEALEVEERP